MAGIFSFQIMTILVQPVTLVLTQKVQKKGMTVAMDTFSAAVKVIFVMGILKQFNIKKISNQPLKNLQRRKKMIHHWS